MSSCKEARQYWPIIPSFPSIPRHSSKSPNWFTFPFSNPEGIFAVASNTGAFARVDNVQICKIRHNIFHLQSKFTVGTKNSNYHFLNRHKCHSERTFFRSHETRIYLSIDLHQWPWKNFLSWTFEARIKLKESRILDPRCKTRIPSSTSLFLVSKGNEYFARQQYLLNRGKNNVSME